MTLGSRLEETGGRPTGFDYLRILLACGVVVVHCVGLSYGATFANAFYGIPLVHAASMLVLPMFFSLSGFLVAGSMARSKTLLGFLGLRAIRIYPALAVEVVLSALILGPLFTTLPVHQYFSSRLFFRYLFNVTGHISFYLPGVFHSNPNPDLVNYQLWTVPFELYCYASSAVLMLLGATKRPRLFVSLTVALLAVELLLHVHHYRHDLTKSDFASHLGGPLLVCSFLFGVSLYLFSDVIPWSRRWGLASAIASVLLLSVPLGEYLGVVSATYLTIYLGLLNPPKRGILRGADYSYGVYLYGWPVQQALVATFAWGRVWWMNMVVALLLAGAFAAASWHFVEQPALGLKGPLRRLEGRWLRLRDHPTTRSVFVVFSRNRAGENVGA